MADAPGSAGFGTCTAVERLLGVLELATCDGCDDCGLRCTEDVPMTQAEFRTIAAHVGEAVGTLAGGHGANLGARASPPAVAAGAWVDLGDGIGFRACCFRDVSSGCCTVYPVRPLVCRLMGHVPWMPCPTGRVTTTVAAERALAALEEYCRMKRAPYKVWLHWDGTMEATYVEDHNQGCVRGGACGRRRMRRT